MTWEFKSLRFRIEHQFLFIYSDMKQNILTKHQKQKLKQIGNRHIQHMIKVVEWIYENRSTSKYEKFEWPEYAGMPDQLIDELPLAAEDIINDYWRWQCSYNKSDITKLFETLINA